MDGRLRRHPRKFALPKALQTTNFVCCLAFLLFVCLRKQAFDTASKQKSLSTLLRGFVACIELHSNQMWKDLREFYKLTRVFENLHKKKSAYKADFLNLDVIPENNSYFLK